MAWAIKLALFLIIVFVTAWFFFGINNQPPQTTNTLNASNDTVSNTTTLNEDNSQEVSLNATNTTQEESNKTQRIFVNIDDDPVKGDENAPVTVVMFADFQCPFSLNFWLKTLPKLEEQYIKTGKVKLVYKDFPLNSIHPQAQKAAEAAECADDQGKFWEYHDVLFERQREWGSTQGTEKFKEYAQELGLDAEQFAECLDSGKYADEVSNDYNDGKNYSVSGTPTFFVNGIKVAGAQPFSKFKQIIDNELSTE